MENTDREPIVLDVEECQDCGIFVLAEDLDALGSCPDCREPEFAAFQE